MKNLRKFITNLLLITVLYVCFQHGPHRAMHANQLPAVPSSHMGTVCGLCLWFVPRLLNF